MTAIQPSPLTPLFAAEPEALRCPYERYAQLRDGAPVFEDTENGVFVVTRHADVEHVMAQPQLFSSMNPIGPTAAGMITALQRVFATIPPEDAERVMVIMSRGNVLLTQDPPTHTRHRRILNKALTPRSVELIEGDIRKICHSLIDTFAERGSVELVSEYCTPAPIQVLATLLGVPLDRAADFARWAEAINAHIGAHQSDEELSASLELQMEFWDFCQAEIEDRIRSPRDDLFSALALAGNDDETPLTLNEKLGFCSQLIPAGSDTTSKHVSSFLLMLCQDPDLMARARDTDQLSLYLEESLRLESPVQGLFRVATADTELGGVAIPKGSYVWAVFASANRDETVFKDPEDFDPARERLRSHQAFGHGPHTCMGAPLARLVSKIAVAALLERLDDIRLSDPGFAPDYDPSYIMRGLRALPLSFTARRSPALSS